MGSIMDMVKEQIPGIYIHSLQIGDSMFEDILNGFLKPIHEQVPYIVLFLKWLLFKWLVSVCRWRDANLYNKLDIDTTYNFLNRYWYQ